MNSEVRPPIPLTISGLCLPNNLIRWRETVLNRLAGAGPLPVINDQAAGEPVSPAGDLAARIKAALTGLKASVMNEEGTAVHYTALRENPAYIAHRQSNLTALRQFDPLTLPNPEAARAFWLNLYNALVLDAVIHFAVQVSVTERFLGILTFFRRAAYLVGGQRVSLEDMEHGILRGNRGHPYLPGSHFAANDPRLAWALPLDRRIHFALNCGGVSCPPIRAYVPEKLDQQLEWAARGFVDTTVSVRPERHEVVLSPIFRWYAADFGGRAGITRFLLDHFPDDARRSSLLTAGDGFRFTYTRYDWGLNQASKTSFR